MISKKILAFLLCMTLLVTAACVSPQPAPDPVADAPASAADDSAPTLTESDTSGGLADATISLLSRSFTLNSMYVFEVAHEQLQAWQSENPNITVINESVFDEDQFNNRFTIAVSSGDIPTIFSHYGGGAFKPYIDSGMVLDLEPYLLEDPEWYNSFIEGALAFSQYPDISGIFAVPIDMFATGIFYNKTLFAQAGVSPPNTIAEFEAACEALLAAGIQPMTFGDANSFRCGHLIGDILMKRHGSSFMHDLADGRQAYTDPEFVEVLQLMKSWQDRGFLGANVATLDVDGERTNFRTGQTAMIQHLVSQYGNIMGDGATVEDHEVGFIPFPYFDEAPEHRNAWHSGASLLHSIATDASEAEIAAAISLLKMYTGLETAAIQVERGEGTFLSAIRGAPVSANPVPAIVEFTAVYPNATDAGKEPGEYSTNPAMRNLIRDQIQAMFAGTPPEEVARILQAA